jgi:ADP-L-glycero-D-manno-heptose 6-epimerase
MIIITGAAGFIGSVLVSELNKKGIDDLILVDDFTKKSKENNLDSKKFIEKVNRNGFFDWLQLNHQKIDFVLHIGARTDTAEFNREIFDKLNLNYSRQMWEACSVFKIPLIYASSAATYGNGEFGYDDNHEIIEKLKPLNPYGVSKNEFDKWVLKEDNQPPFWAGLKFFNVYGPNEYHKGRMASVVYHAYNQIEKSGKLNLFKSHKDDVKDGEQKRDFVYVKDVAKVIMFLMENKADSGIYNLGTGNARTFNDLAKAIFSALNLEPNIDYVPTPADIREKYQYFTEANIKKLRKAGYKEEFYSIEEAVDEYVNKYLKDKKYI